MGRMQLIFENHDIALAEMNLLPKTRDYLQRFIRAKAAEYSEIYYEYRPGKGYGQFHRSDEVYQTMHDIYANLTEDFKDLSIPEVFSSPNALLAKMNWFVEILKQRSKLFDDVAVYCEVKGIPLSDAVLTIDNVRHEVIDAFEHSILIAEEEVAGAPAEEHDASETPAKEKRWYHDGRVRAAFVTGGFMVLVFLLNLIFSRPTSTTSSETVTLPRDSISKSNVSEDPFTLEYQRIAARQAESLKARLQLRKAKALRELTPAETNLSLGEMPRGTYGFIYASELKKKEGSLTRISSGYTFEMHKTALGEILAVGFVNDDAAALLMRESRRDTTAATLYSDYWESATKIVSIPMVALSPGFRTRGIELSQWANLVAAEVKIAPKTAR
jgi:hypothetical protein